MLGEMAMGLLATAHRVYRGALPGARGLGLLERPLKWGVSKGIHPAIRDGRGSLHYLDDSIVAWEILRKGEWEGRQSALVEGLLRPGDTFVHVGANSGYYCVLAGRSVGPGGRVLGIEIQADMCDLARRTAGLNALANVRILEMGCWSSEQTGSVEDRGASVLASVKPGSGPVRLARLDDVLRTEGIERAAVLMVDTEGADLEVLKGAAESLERMKPIVIAEVDHLARYGSTAADLVAYMDQRGFVSFPMQSQFSLDYVFFSPHDRARVGRWLNAG